MEQRKFSLQIESLTKSLQKTDKDQIPRARALLIFVGLLTSFVLFAYAVWGLIALADYDMAAIFGLLGIALFLGLSIKLKGPGANIEINRLPVDEMSKKETQENR